MEKLINDFKITFTKGDTYALAVKFKNTTEDLRLAFFTVKENPDDEPLIQKSLGAGIDKIDDRAYKNEKTYKVQLQAEDTANLEARLQYLYDLQVTVGNVVKTVLSGVFVVNQTVTGTGAGTTTQSLDVAVDDELEVEFETTPATNGIEYETDPVANAKIGDMTALKTTNKETLVKAINEAKNDAKTNASTIQSVNSKATTNASNISQILNGGKTVSKATTATNATTANNYSSGGEIDKALQGKANSGHTHSDYLKHTADSQTITGKLKVTGGVECNVLGTINDVEIWNDNGVLKFGDFPIPYRIPLMAEQEVKILINGSGQFLYDFGTNLNNVTLEISVKNKGTKKVTLDLSNGNDASVDIILHASSVSTYLFEFINFRFSNGKVFVKLYERKTGEVINQISGTYTISITQIIE